MRLLWILFGVVVMVASTATVRGGKIVPEKVRYDNFRVYKVFLENRSQLEIVKQLESISTKILIWKEYDEVSKEVHVMVDPAGLLVFNRLVGNARLKTELMIPNVQKLIEEEAQGMSSDDMSFGWTRYYSLDDIEAWLDDILAAHPDVTEGFILGKSYEGRLIRGLKISYKSGNPGIFIESNIHAREWITSATCTWFINQLLTSDRPEVRNLAENHDWYIVPVFNVDGFVYSHDLNRMWRRTRQPSANSTCIGVDANRNFDSHWMANGGASAAPCSETYAGDKPFSEPEAQALADYVTSIADKLNIYLSFHSYGQYLLSPYGHTIEETPENYDDMLTIGEKFSAAIKALPYQTVYTYGSTATTLYVASGSSVDWMFNELGIKLGYTIEFRDKGRYGFILPPAQILPNCEELMAGMIALVDTSKDLGYV